MALLQSTSLEFGARPVQRLITIMYAPLRTCETIRVGKYFVDVSRIVHPISRNIEGTADDQSVGNQIDKSGLYDATLVVSFLRPGVWKIQIYTRDRCGRNLLTQDLDRIVIYKAQINDAGLARSQQTMPYARIVHLNSQKILPGVLRRLFDESLAIAETDFQHTVFWFPLGTLLRALGGIPLDRSRASSSVQQVIAAFDANEKFNFALAPEGTRSLTAGWKSGFYRIAEGAKVPIFMCFFDFRNKRLGIGPKLELSGDQGADMQVFKDYYSGIEGRRPELTSPVRLL